MQNYLKDRTTYILYCHINKVDGKHYFGITQQNPNKRWQNGYGYISNKYFYRAIQKYSWNGFYHIILKENLSMQNACDLEQYYIELYNTTNPKYGYNISSGGESGSIGLKRPYESDDYNRKKVICLNDMKIYNSITECSAYYKLNISNVSKCCRENEIRNYRDFIVHKGYYYFMFYNENKNYADIKHKIESYKEYLKDNSLLNNKQSSKEKDIIHINTGKVYSNAHQINRLLGYNYSEVSAICKAYSDKDWNRKAPKKQSMGDCDNLQYFMYLDDFNKLNKSYYELYRDLLKQTLSTKYRPVRKIDTNEAFITAIEASKITGESSQKIRHHLRKDCKNINWEYVEDLYDFIDNVYIKLRKDSNNV